MTDIATTGAIPIGDYLAIIRRQRGRMLAVGLGLLVVAATLIAIWPATYRSMATILISQIDIPTNLVTTTSPDTFADERVQAIQQRITTTPNLKAIIQKRNLYADQRGTVGDFGGRKHSSASAGRPCKSAKSAAIDDPSLRVERRRTLRVRECRRVLRPWDGRNASDLACGIDHKHRQAGWVDEQR